MKGRGVGVTQIMTGVRRDIEALFAKFKSSGTVRFADFKKAFKEVKFSLIACGRTSEIELREFNEKLLLLALSYCSPKNDLQVRCGAVYLLYVVYNLQSLKYQMKIRITPTQLEELLEFMRHKLHHQYHYDTLYIIHKLFIDQAFHFCLFSDEHNPLNFKRFDVNQGDVETEATDPGDSHKDLVRQIADSEFVADVYDMHKRYEESKSNLSGAGALNILSGNPADYICKIAADCQEKIERRVFSKRTGDRRESARSPVKERRSAIREKAFSGLTKQAKHRRHRQELRAEEGDSEHNVSKAESAIEVELVPKNEEENIGLVVPAAEKEERKEKAKRGAKSKKDKEKGKPGPKPRPKAAEIEPPTKRGRPAKPQAPKKRTKKSIQQQNIPAINDTADQDGVGRLRSTSSVKQRNGRTKKTTGGRPRLTDSPKKTRSSDYAMRTVDDAVGRALKMAETTKKKAEKRKKLGEETEQAKSQPKSKKSSKQEKKK